MEKFYEGTSFLWGVVIYRKLSLSLSSSLIEFLLLEGSFNLTYTLMIIAPNLWSLQFLI